mmetsp:Transcript_9057/g.29031  ORF Transcript_9057/g.29031 Transcript_9057/m.29031 type:complete len:248 (+) Transcript_9057:33-776(+)
MLAVLGFSTATFNPADCSSSYALLERPNAEWPVGATDTFAASTREKKTRKWRKMVEPWWDHELVSVPSTHGQRNITIALHRWRARHAVTLGGGRRPALVLWVHGGGMVLPSGRLGDPQIGILRRLGPQLLIAAVEYALAPRYPCPAAAEDVIDSLDWVLSHAAALGGDPGRVAVMGESAGGNLAAVAALHAARRRLPVRFAGVFYPMVENAVASPSYSLFSQGPGLRKCAMEFFWRAYCPTAEAGQR